MATHNTIYLSFYVVGRLCGGKHLVGGPSAVVWFVNLNTGTEEQRAINK